MAVHESMWVSLVIVDRVQGFQLAPSTGLSTAGYFLPKDGSRASSRNVQFSFLNLTMDKGQISSDVEKVKSQEGC
jgi:hypothetical protein